MIRDHHLMQVHFSSGNVLDVYLTQTAPKNFNQVCEWSQYPPSQGDLAEFQALVVDEMVERTQKIMTLQTLPHSV
jgi:hypothetical protein